MSRPFRAWLPLNAKPRALPWANLFRPFGAGGAEGSEMAWGSRRPPGDGLVGDVQPDCFAINF